MAAVVSDNDGSVFITKAEFEALKDDFNEQIDNYNNSIDNKIDGAIASYLAGIQLDKPITEKIINSTWESVSNVNGVFENEWNMPELTQMFQLCYGWQSDDRESPLRAPWNKFLTGQLNSVIPQGYSTAGTNKRNLVKNSGPNASPTNLIWDGVALRFHEMYFLIRTAYYDGFDIKTNTWDLAWLDRPDISDYGMSFRDFFRLAPIGDLAAATTNTKTLWPFIMRWAYTADDNVWRYLQANWNYMTTHDTLQTSITLEPNSSGKTKEYEHIISYKGSDSWRVFNQNKDYSQKAAESTLTSDNVFTKGSSVVEQYCMIYGQKWNTNGADVSVNKYKYDGDTAHKGAEISITLDTTLTDIFPNLGIILNKQNANVIYQDDKTQEIEIGHEKVTKAPVTLEKGFQLLASKENDVVEWEPYFSYTHVHNSTSGYAPDNSHEVDIYFSNGPFTDQVTTTKAIRVQVGDNTALKDFATTTNRKCKVKFTMPATGLVYVKFVPHFTGTSYLSNDWILTLDLSKCNTYTYVRE